jgi:CRP-like cAMP-binding protein
LDSRTCVQVPILFNLSDSQLLELASHLEPRSVAPGEVVVKEGDEGDSFYIIEEGTFCCYQNDGTKLALIDRGSCFGELALLHNDKRKCNVAAERSGGALHRTRMRCMHAVLCQPHCEARLARTQRNSSHNLARAETARSVTLCC